MGTGLADSRLTKIPALCPSPVPAAIWRRVAAQSRQKVGAVQGHGGIGPRQLAFNNGCAGSAQFQSRVPRATAPQVNGRSALTKKPSKLTNVAANNGAAVVAVFTASLRSLLIAFL